MKKYSALNQVMTLYAKNKIERDNGRIYKSGKNSFQLCEDDTRPIGMHLVKNGNPEQIRLDFFKRKMRIMPGQSVRCWDIEGRKDNNPVLTFKGEMSYCSVLIKNCRKCQHYIKAGKLRYACCQLRRRI